MYRTKKLYPTPEEYRFSNEVEVPVSQAVTYLQSLLGKVPEEERSSLRIRGWGGVSIWYDHRLNEAEVFAETLERVREIIRSAGGRGLTAQQVEEITKVIGN